jgi:AcrR family transcriptional regulator
VSAVADELGVAHPTLYRHVRDRADLLTLAVETVLRGVARPLFSVSPNGGPLPLSGSRRTGPTASWRSCSTASPPPSRRSDDGGRDAGGPLGELDRLFPTESLPRVADGVRGGSLRERIPQPTPLRRR